MKKSKLLGKELARKDKVVCILASHFLPFFNNSTEKLKNNFNVPQVRTLEGRLTEARRSEAVDYEKEARKFKLKYEILARNEINKKVSELNDFLGQRAKDQEVTRNQG